MPKTVVRLLGILLIAVVISGCGKPKTINGTNYDTVGLFNEKNPNIHYEVSVGNVVWSIVLIETVVCPIYFVGFSIYNPICTKKEWEAKSQ